MEYEITSGRTENISVHVEIPSALIWTATEGWVVSGAISPKRNEQRVTLKVHSFDSLSSGINQNLEWKIAAFDELSWDPSTHLSLLAAGGGGLTSRVGMEL